MRKFKSTTVRKFGVIVLIFTLLLSQGGMVLKNHIIPKKKIIKAINSNILAKFRSQYIVIPHKKIIDEKVKIINIEMARKPKAMVFVITAYDLSVASCGKSTSDPAYGISRGGYDLTGKTWRTARSISVDTNIIPLGTRVLIKFKDKKYSKYEGVYVANDTGSAIKGRKIDLFLGDFGSEKPSKSAINFGKVLADVTILKN